MDPGDDDAASELFRKRGRIHSRRADLCETSTGAPFSADFGDGSDIASVTTQGKSSPSIYDIVYGPGRPAPESSFIHLTGKAFLETPNPSEVDLGQRDIHARVTLGDPWFGAQNSGNGTMSLPSGFLTLAIQMMDDAGNWHDAAVTTASPTDKTLNANVRLPTGNIVRAVLRESASWNGYFAVTNATLAVLRNANPIRRTPAVVFRELDDSSPSALHARRYSHPLSS